MYGIIRNPIHNSDISRDVDHDTSTRISGSTKGNGSSMQVPTSSVRQDQSRTISEARDPEKLKQFLNRFKYDNTDIVKRPGYNEIDKYVIPALRKAVRTLKLPTTLLEYEMKQMERVYWPRSVFIAKIFNSQMEPFTKVGNIPVDSDDNINSFSTTFKFSDHSTFQPDLDRNKRAMKKAAGLPFFGKKGDALAGALQYNVTVVKPDPKLGNCYSVLPGTRTQQSEPGNEKVRLVWSIPVHIWQLECELADDAITRTIEACQQAKSEIQQFYWDPRVNLLQWFNKFANQVVQWVSLDSSQYDSSVQANELADVVEHINSKYELKELLKQYLAYSDIVMPEGPMQRSGGMPSGSKVTNWGDGWTNVKDILQVMARLNLLKFVVCVLVNGDDITLGISTRLTLKNLQDISKHTRRNISPDKSVCWNDALLNSKWYVGNGICTRSIFRATNSLMFKERQADALTMNAVYTAIARHQILLDVEMNPMYEVLAKNLAQYEEVPLAKAMADERWEQTLTAYIEDHTYDDSIDPKVFVQNLQNSRYAKEFAK